MVSSYSIESAPPAVISYVLGDPSETFGPYGFAQDPPCGYPETVTIVNEPDEPLFTHDEEQRTFMLNESIDDRFLGTYFIEITSQFLQRNIDGTQTPVSRTLYVQLTVTPCIVQSYDVIEAPESEIRYTLGDPPLTFGPYLI